MIKIKEVINLLFRNHVTKCLFEVAEFLESDYEFLSK